MPYGYSDVEWLGDYWTTDLEGKPLHIGIVKGSAYNSTGETSEVNLTMSPYASAGAYEVPNYGEAAGQAPVALTEETIRKEIAALGGGAPTGAPEGNSLPLPALALDSPGVGVSMPALAIDSPGAIPPQSTTTLTASNALVGLGLVYVGLKLLHGKNRLRIKRAKARRRTK